MKIQDLKIGLGTWKSPIDKAGAAVEFALREAEYNHIDCAAIYRNEKEIGEAFKNVFNSGSRKREEVFITSKLWNTEHARDHVLPACKQTLADLQLEYLDLYLMHWGIATVPSDDNAQNIHGRYEEKLNADGFLITEKIPIRETWEAMEELVKAGLVKAIGVSNFTAPMIVDLLSYANIKPAMNQIELHPYLQQTALVEFCRYNDIAVTAYSPQGSPGNYGKAKGLPVLGEDPIIVEIAKHHSKSPTQIMLRWAIQRNTIPIPKSLNPEHLKENIDVFDFELSFDNMQKIAGLDRGLRFVNPSDWWKIPYFG